MPAEGWRPLPTHRRRRAGCLHARPGAGSV